jgi:hypothetical protein
MNHLTGLKPPSFSSVLSNSALLGIASTTRSPTQSAIVQPRRLGRLANLKVSRNCLTSVRPPADVLGTD